MNMVFMALASSLAFLSGDAGASSGVLDTIMTMVPKALNFVGTVLSAVVSIDLFGMMLAISLIGLGLSLVSRMRNTVS